MLRKYIMTFNLLMEHWSASASRRMVDCSIVSGIVALPAELEGQPS